ncbi:VQ motif family protein [Zea mays]|uniref:VQ motif family protein n=1 Tax=Zea mays TaxID=4577 RepID=A0A1D6LR86_MAIZE|nr:VQ motif family protein [Zea mays]AQK81971.1 VQ motif family protein [Zea mays]|eukprot:NP_001148186.2 VQ motif family protein [Zea mays]
MGEHNNDGVSSTSTMRTARPRTPTMLPPTRPKIKIIHIIAPEIIKTDVAHFRDLVQRLTGKAAFCAATDVVTSTPPVGEDDETETSKKRPRPALAPVANDEKSGFTVQVQEETATKKRKIKCEVKVEEGGFGGYELGRSNLWMDLSTGGGFLSFLEEDEGVFQGLAADIDFLQPFGSSRMDFVGEMYAS